MSTTHVIVEIPGGSVVLPRAYYEQLSFSAHQIGDNETVQKLAQKQAQMFATKWDALHPAMFHGRMSK